MPLVTTVPSPLARQVNGPDRAVFNGAWERLCRLTAHPDVLDRAAEGFEKFGMSKAGTRIELGYTTLATDLVRNFVPKSQLGKHGDLSQSEFERVRLFRALVEEYRDDFAALRLKPPMRIGFASIATLGEYDPVRQGFPIQSGAPNVPRDERSRMGRSSNESVRYLHRRAPRTFDFLPLGDAQAQRLLPTLRHREVLVMAAYRVTDIGPADLASAVVTLEDEVYAVYHPALLTKPLAVIREPKTGAPAPTTSAPGAAAGDAVGQKMADLSRQYELLEFNGLPVLGYQHSYFADKALSQRGIVGAQTLVDLIRLHYDPHLLSREREEDGFDPTPLLTRQLKAGELAPFLNPKLSALNGRNRWLGATEFERRRNRDAFIEKYGPVLRGRSLAAPLRFAIYGTVKIGGYDFDREGFSLEIALPISDRASVLNPTTIGDRVGSGITLPPSLRCPSFMPMSADAAEAYVAKLGPPTDPTSSGRRFAVVLLADIPDAPNARPYAGSETVDPTLVERPNLYVRPGRLVVYRDAALQSPLEELPIDVAATPTLVDGIAPPTSRTPFLSERATWLGVMLRDGQTPSPADYAAAARDRLAIDDDYYTYGCPGHPLDPSSWNPSKRDFLSMWYAADLATTAIKGGYFDPAYKPFFPEGFTPHHSSPTPLNAQQLALFQKTLLAGVGKADGPLCVRALVRGGEAPGEPRAVAPVGHEITDRSDPAWESLGDDHRVGSLWEFIEPHRFTDSASPETRRVLALSAQAHELSIAPTEPWVASITTHAGPFDAAVGLKLAKSQVLPSRNPDGFAQPLHVLWADATVVTVYDKSDPPIGGAERKRLGEYQLPSPYADRPSTLDLASQNDAAFVGLPEASGSPSQSGGGAPQQNTAPQASVWQAPKPSPSGATGLTNAAPANAAPSGAAPSVPALEDDPLINWPKLWGLLGRIPPAFYVYPLAAIVTLGAGRIAVGRLLKRRPSTEKTPEEQAALTDKLRRLTKGDLPRAFHALGQKAYALRVGRSELLSHYVEIDRVEAALRERLGDPELTSPQDGEQTARLRRSAQAAVARLGAAVVANSGVVGRESLTLELAVVEDLQRQAAQLQQQLQSLAVA